MKQRRWRRVRGHVGRDDGGRATKASRASSKGARNDERALTVAESRTAERGDDRPWVGDDAMLPRLGGLAETDDKQAEYADWVERMKAKRVEKVETVRELSDDGTAAPDPSYWSSEAVWDESRRLEGEKNALVMSRLELLAVLGLSAGATDEEIVTHYRRLAKEHHPDRLPEADEATRAFHIEQMQRISAAYRALHPSTRS